MRRNCAGNQNILLLTVVLSDQYDHQVSGYYPTDVNRYYSSGHWRGGGVGDTGTTELHCRALLTLTSSCHHKCCFVIQQICPNNSCYRQNKQEFLIRPPLPQCIKMWHISSKKLLLLSFCLAGWLLITKSFCLFVLLTRYSGATVVVSSTHSLWGVNLLLLKQRK